MLLLIPLGLLLVALLLGAAYESRQARLDVQRCPPPGRLVAVDGFRLHLDCAGSGRPPVILDAGLGDSSRVWSGLQPEIAARLRVCSYDRAGLGWSEPGPRPRTYRQAALELHTLLERAGETPPFILVGHSAGVNTVRLFAELYPQEVAGLVLIEPPLLPAGVPPLLTAVLRLGRLGLNALARTGLIRLLGSRGRLRLLFGGVNPPRDLAGQAGFLYRPESLKTSLAEIDALPESIRLVNASARPGAWGDRPVIVLAAHKGAALPPKHARALAALAGLSANGRVKSVRGSHFIPFEHPGVVIESILEVAGAAL